MLRCPTGPLLPGTTFRDPAKQHFPKTPQFETVNGVCMLLHRRDSSTAKTDPIFDVSCPPYELPSLYPQREGPKLPSWITHDRKALCFHGYFKEPLLEFHNASYVVRKVKILFYLSDGTIQIVEPRVENSGIPQGCLVSRQRIPRKSPCDNDFISIFDLNVDRTVKIFHRVYHITDCDKYTRDFLNRAGIPVPDPIPIPADPYTEVRNKAEYRAKIYKPASVSFQKFLEFDRKVLRFEAYWDDRSENGECRNFEVRYYLADDTIEIKERFPLNAGRESPSLFLKRQKLPKEWLGLPLPGQETHMTVLNVLGSGIRGGRVMEDRLGLGKRKITYYKDYDLSIGTHLNVLGREFILTNCDEFTQDYYRKKYGLEEFNPLTNPAKYVRPPCDDRAKFPLPAYNGWGTHEDSEQNCVHLEPKPPQIDFKKFTFYEKYALRFGAKMISPIKENCDRIFIITYFLCNDTLQIFEVTERNTGFLGGEFLKRSRVYLPNQEIYSSRRPESFKPHHFFIGGTVNLNGHIFNIVSADEYTLLFMENQPHQFPYANIEKIITKIRKPLESNYKNFISMYLEDLEKICKDGKEISIITYATLRKALISLLGNDIVDHEIITLARHFSAEKDGGPRCEREKVRSTIHYNIRLKIWDDMERLKEHLYHVDPRQPRYMPESKIRNTILTCRLPFSKDLTDIFMEVLNRNEKGEIDVCDFVEFLDPVKKKSFTFTPQSVWFELCSRTPFMEKGRCVDWEKLLEKIGLEEKLLQETK